MVYNTRYIAIYENQEKQRQQNIRFLNAHFISFQMNLVSRHLVTIITSKMPIYERPPNTDVGFPRGKGLKRVKVKTIYGFKQNCLLIFKK